MKAKLFLYIFLSLFAFTFLLSSCKKDKQKTPEESAPYIQKWIYDNMKQWYYWHAKITATPDYTLAPEAFFKSLLYKAADGDRFSWIQNATDLQNSLKGVYTESGYEFKLYLESQGSANVIGQITYIKKNSPAQTAGLLRGDIFSEVNGTQLTTSNYATLLGLTSSAHTLRVKRYDADLQTLLTDKVYNLGVVELADNPVFKDTVYTFTGKKVGYLVYNFFASGPTNNSTVYDDQVDAVFSKFKASNVNELILDLRFNGGGSIYSADNLASEIVPNYTSTKVFVTYDFNQSPGAIKEYGGSLFADRFIAKTNNVGNNLSRLFILTSRGTASASELMINCLRPSLEVVTIGDTTYGKNVGSFTITDTVNASNTWGLQPIVLKLSNSLGQSDYTNGFPPAYYDRDNYFFLRPLGDIREPLLNRALLVITNGTLKKADPGKVISGKNIASSISLNPNRSTMYITPKDFHRK